MSFARRYLLMLLMTAGLGLSGMNAEAAVNIQCPGGPNVVCKHLTAGDGWVKMADGRSLYAFGFYNVTGVPASNAITTGLQNAQFSAPRLEFKEDDLVYLTLTNVGVINRPDLFDPHSVHFHGFPNAASIYDGLPESAIVALPGSSYTYFYKLNDPGTYIYHCHVEAAEHMQMGMLGNLYVHPKQDGKSKTFGGKTYNKFAYNDGDGSTGYDVEYPIQLTSMDGTFHDLHLGIQPLPFANMLDTYSMLNGRSYPDTADPKGDGSNNLPIFPPPAERADQGTSSQPLSSLITATQGQTVLLRITNLSTTHYNTMSAMGLPMKVVGTGAHILRGPGGQNLYYDSNSVTLGGGESADVLIDTAGVPRGTYYLYTTNLNYLSNDNEDFGGMMTEIVIN